MTTNEAWTLIHFACEKNGCPEVANRIQLKWSNRMTRAMGNVRHVLSEDRYLIKLSTPLFSNANEEQQRETVLHEVCHVIDGIVNNRKMSHGPSWKACMIKCGLKPTRYHKVDRTGIKRKVKRFDYTCPSCGQVYRLTAGKHDKATQYRARYHCRECHARIEFTGRSLLV